MMKRLERTGRAVLLLAAFATAGCYTYVPMDQPRRGATVRVDIPVTSSVGGSAREPRTETFEGRIVGMGDTLLLETRLRQTVGTHGEFVSSDTIRVRSSSFSNLEERVLSKPRTALFTAALVGGAVLGLTAIDALGGGQDGEGPPNGGNQSSVISRPFSTGWQLFGVRIPLRLPSG